MIPATADGLSAARLDEVLTVDAHPVDARFPLVCFDEAGKELQQEYRPPTRSRPERPARIDHHTPNHGSWVNMADLEFRALNAHCLARRIPDRPTLLREITAWVADRNAQQVIVRWSFTVTDGHRTMPQVSPHHPDP